MFSCIRLRHWTSSGRMAYVQLGYRQLYLRLRHIKTAGLKVREGNEMDKSGGNPDAD